MTRERVRWTMGTLCSIKAPGAPAGAVTAAFEEIGRWDRIHSAYRDVSELTRVIRAAGLGPLRVSPDFFVAAASALRFAELSGGLFDPTLRPVMKRGPDALPLTGWRKVSLDARSSKL